MSDVQIIKDSQNYKISHLSENKTFSFTEDKQMKQTFKISPSVDQGDIVISDDFLICIANLDVLTDLNIPSIFVQVVEKDKWKKMS
jgi:hypothetical protein